MARFLFRHWSAAAILCAVAAWAVFYLPQTPSFAVFQLRRAIDARNAEAATRYVDFESVVRHAGYEMVAGDQGGGGNDPFSRLLGRGAVELLAKPTAKVVEGWARHEVETGAQEVQMPPVAVLGSIVMLHRSGDSASTSFRDRKGREWQISMARNGEGQWQVVEIKNIRQLLEKLRAEDDKRLNAP